MYDASSKLKLFCVVQRLRVSPYGLPRVAAAPIFSFIETFVLFVSYLRGEVVFVQVKCVLFILQFGIID